MALRVDKDLASRCIQCGSCTSVCPSASLGGINPRRTVAAYKRGAIDVSSLWMCTTCSLCAAVCPNGVDPVLIVECSRSSAQPDVVTDIVSYVLEKGVSTPPIRSSGFGVAEARRDLVEGYRAFINRIATRSYSAKIYTPSRILREYLINTARHSSRAIHNVEKVLVYPGCIALNVYPTIVESCIDVLQRLGLEAVVIGKDFLCCGYPLVASGTRGVEVFIYTSAIVDAVARSLGVDLIVTPCNGCLYALHTGYAYAHRLKDVAEEAKKIVSSVIGEEPRWSTPIASVLELTSSRIEILGIDLRKRIAPFYGCHFVSLKMLKNEDPHEIHRIAKALATEVVEHPQWYGCCGGFTPTSLDLVKRLSIPVLEDTYIGGAEIVVTPCSGCLANLDRVATYMAMESRSFAKPIHVAQLLAYVATGSENVLRDLTYRSVL